MLAISDCRTAYSPENPTEILEEYRKTKYEDLRIRVPIGKKAIIKKHVESTGESLNTFVNIAIDEKMERDSKMNSQNN